MLDIYVFQGIVSLLLLLYCIKPAVKNFQDVPGITLLPILACGIIALAFLITGYQPQLVLLALFAIWQSIASLPALARQASRLRTDDWRDVPRLRLALRLALLLAASAAAFYFAPTEAPLFSAFSRAPWLVDAHIPVEASPNEPPSAQSLPLALYAPPKNKAGKEDVLILIVPPALGSSASVDRMARELAARGFWTISMGSPGTDFPAVLSDGSRVWPAAGRTISKALSSLSHPASVRAQRQRTLAAGPKTAVIRAAHRWLAIESQNGWQAIEGGPSWFKPSRMAVIGVGDGAYAATSLAQEMGQVWTLEEEAPVLPVTALLLAEPLFTGNTNRNNDGKPASFAGFWRQFILWLGFARAGDTSPTQDPTNAFSAPIPLLITASSLLDASEKAPWRYVAATNFVEEHRAPAAILAIPDALPSDFSELACRTPLAALALDRQFKPRQKSQQPEEPSPDTISRCVEIQAAFLELALYGIQTPDTPLKEYPLRTNAHWQYPVSTGILEAQ